jgi:hypothetical protein
MVVAAALLMAGCSGSGSNATAPTAAASGRPSASSAPSLVPSQPDWVTLPGHVDAWDPTTLLMSPMDGSAGYSLIGTTKDWQAQIDLASAVAPATLDVDADGNTIQDAALDPASAAYPDGIAVITTSATTSASGLTPQKDRDYLLRFDAASGKLISKAVIGTAGNGEPVPQPVAATAATAATAGLVATDNDTTATILEQVDVTSGKTVSSTTIASSQLQDTFGSLALLTLLGGNCNRLGVYDVATLSRVSASSGYCLSGDTGGKFLDASQYSAYADPEQSSFPYSATTGRLLGPFTPRGADDAGNLEEVTGPRSTIAVAWDTDNDVNAGFYNAASWSRVYEVRQSEQLGFSCSGVADNDVWVTTSSGNIVVDGMTGKQIESGWRVSPDFGGAGWTVFDGPQPTDGEAQQYLLRSAGPAVNELASAPAASGQ